MQRRAKRKREGDSDGEKRSAKDSRPWPLSRMDVTPRDCRALSSALASKVKSFAKSSESNVEDLFDGLKLHVTSRRRDTKSSRKKILAVLICDYMFMRSSYFRKLMVQRGGRDGGMQWFLTSTIAADVTSATERRLRETVLRAMYKWTEKYGDVLPQVQIAYRWVENRVGKAEIDIARAADPELLEKQRKERVRREKLVRLEACKADIADAKCEIEDILRGIVRCMRMLLPQLSEFKERKSIGVSVAKLIVDPVMSAESAPSSSDRETCDMRTDRRLDMTNGSSVSAANTDNDIDDDDDDDEWEEVVTSNSTRKKTTRAPDSNAFEAAKDETPKPPQTTSADLHEWSRMHGLGAANYEIRVDVDMVVTVDQDNAPVVEQLTDLRKEIERHHIPKIGEWIALLDSLLSDDASEEEHRKMRTSLQILRRRALETLERCSAVNFTRVLPNAGPS